MIKSFPAPLVTGLMGKKGEKWLKDLNTNFTEFAPLMLGMTSEENPSYLVRRVVFNYMSDLNLTLEDEFIFTRVSSEGSFEGKVLPLFTAVRSKDKILLTFLQQFFLIIHVVHL